MTLIHERKPDLGAFSRIRQRPARRGRLRASVERPGAGDAPDRPVQRPHGPSVAGLSQLSAAHPGRELRKGHHSPARTGKAAQKRAAPDRGAAHRQRRQLAMGRLHRGAKLVWKCAEADERPRSVGHPERRSSLFHPRSKSFFTVSESNNDCNFNVSPLIKSALQTRSERMLFP